MQWSKTQLISAVMVTGLITLFTHLTPLSDFATAWAEDPPSAESAEGIEGEEQPCPECPECPDPAKVVLRGLEEKRKTIDQAQEKLEQERKDLERYAEQVDEKLVSLEKMKQQIKEDLARLDEQKSKKTRDEKAEYEAKLGRLVKMYAGMKPKNAALIVDKMDLKVAEEIFLRMRETSASQILSFVNSEKAAKISERLAYKRD
ncbi:MAG: hypothetical protein MI747_12080 [Desulfobacterales bacterium]|nr:hypothetical protein [Desulfobacterales bacterium]